MNSYNNGLFRDVLVVGGSSGIGAAIVYELINSGAKTVYVADIVEPLIEDSKIKYIKIDLRHESLDRLVLDVDALIVTAGIGQLAAFEDIHESDIEKCFRVNTLSAIKLIKKYYPIINSKQEFGVAIISSITGLVASPLYSIYSSTKAALHRFIQAINAELHYRNTTNRILEVAPGYIKGTNFHGGQTDISMLKGLAKDIILAMEKKESLYIPNYEDVYNDVINRYHNNPHQFALDSMEYKIKNKRDKASTKLCKVGYLSGTFDLFHIGHLNLLKRAKEHCDYLVVGVHADTAHKANREIFIPLEERMEVLRSVRYVDEVIICPSEDIDAYKTIKYDLLFVGSDYKNTERFNRYEEYFKNTDTKIIYFPYTNTTSSTQIRKIIKNVIVN